MASLPTREAPDSSAAQTNASKILSSIQDQLRGPGGAVAIVKDGENLARHTYGYADIDRRIPLTPQMHMPICSISKQMVCLVLVSLKHEPTPLMAKFPGDIWEQLAVELQKVLPNLVERGLTVPDLYNMQSGIRDYWAMTTLWGAQPEGQFSIALDAPQAIARTRSFHFEPGTEYSYSNVNFHILGSMIEAVAGQSLGQLLDERVFKPAGMRSAALCPNTAGHPLPVVGYDGDEKHGYKAGINRIEWSGDAGIVATLDDMIAYEKWLDKTYAEEGSLYNTVARSTTYRDGSVAKYGYGLARGETAGKAWLGHGGALRGFRLWRMHLPEEHISIVVMFNHEGDSAAPADAILKRLLNWQEPEKALSTAESNLFGAYLDVETQLLVRVEKSDDAGYVNVTYHIAPEKTRLTSGTSVESKGMTGKLETDTLHVQRLRDNRVLQAKRIFTVKDEEALPKGDQYTGSYQCADSANIFHCFGAGSMLYGSFDGYLGKGPAHTMQHVGEDIWLLSNPRGMDAPAPGDWTVVFRRDGSGVVTNATIGCWLARKNEYTRVS
ncbi:hypothetical protein CKM354_000749800 [Cercospora kikuchii]|uniref:D-aminopeptidase n=1 Tax=Cercospora kikuchii TaxID=84275 RepID=A0A9P3FJ55_9PEZI|nr:uncharacterized protein CKM354_000749800 [Cercospora kikuchii]GIZ44295.1 hypothetical protein CKM354_000749800 [Cercospora kikuchii]